jgi:hypothetical protein
LRVTIASDSTGVISIDDGGNTITVDGTVTANLGATDNAVLDAIQAAVELIDNAISGSEMQVDVLTMPTVTIQDGGNTITIDGTVDLGATDNAVLDAIQTAAEACQTALEATLTVSGTVTANLGATDNAVLDTIATNTGAALTDTELRATDVPVTLDSEVVAVDATGQGDVPVTLDSEVVSVDATGQGDVPITLDGEAVVLGAGSAAIGKLAANSGVDIGDVDVTSISAGENHIGEVGLPDDTITITCSLDTSAYADGDVLFATQEIANAVRVNGDTCILQSVHVVDIDDQGVEMDLIFFNANTSLGTENSAPDIDDTEVLTTLGIVNVPDWTDLGANQIATVTGIGLVLEAGAATTSLYVAGITRGAPTYTASGLQITFGFLRN